MYPSLPFDFVVFGIAISFQGSADSRRAWRDKVRAAAMEKLPEGHFLLDMPLTVTIYLFPRDTMRGDIDNRVKPILDAMKQLVYEDDEQVNRLVVQKFEMERRMEIGEAGRIAPSLKAAIDGEGPAVYIRVSDDLRGE